MSEQVTTCIVAVAFPATALRLEITGIAFEWRGKMRTLRFRNYKFPSGRKIQAIPRHFVDDQECFHARSVMSVKIRKEIEHNCPGLRIFVTRSLDGKLPSFHITKASGLPFEHDQLTIIELHG